MKQWQIIAYDIKDKRRLSRVHRRLKKDALALQKSVFATKKTTAELNALLDDLLALVDSGEDDIRSYPIHRLTDIWSLGQQNVAVENLTFARSPKSARTIKGAFRKPQWLANLFRH